MASINGITLKNIKYQTDHEGMGIYSGTIYIDGKRAGSWEQSFWGGSDRYCISDVDIDILKERTNMFAEAVPEGTMLREIINIESELDTDLFIDNVLRLSIWEKECKKALKDGYSAIIVVTNVNYTNYIYISKEYIDDWETKCADDIEKIKSSYPKGKEIHVFMIDNMDYFNRTVDKEHSEFEWLN